MTEKSVPMTWADWCQARGLPVGPVDALGFNPHWRSSLARFVQGVPIRHIRSAADAMPGRTVLVWGNQLPEQALPAGCTLVRLEDGFLRSVGLGAHFVKPLSWVFDSRGLYFDATRPSDLEHILQHQEFSADELARAEQLMAAIVAGRISKYNVGAEPWQRPKTDREVILVPGQVERDASIAWGSKHIRTNLALLQQVRQQNPDAWIAYKPHPDVLSGARAPGAQEAAAWQYCNEILGSVNIAQAISAVDTVHTMTSLAGFEALLQGRTVHCHGMPFYAGWGLTSDRYACERRQRRLTLVQLVAGALIHYPLYTDRQGASYATPEQTLNSLQHWGQGTGTWGHQLGLVLRRTTRLGINRLFGAR